MMNDYKELIEELRDKACNSKGYERELCNQAADAIEELEEKLQYTKDNIEEAKEYINFLKEKINSLKHDGYYTGTYIKALMEVEE